MPLDLKPITGSFPQIQHIELSNWNKGVITLIDKSRLPKSALAEARNLFLAEDGVPTVRPGTDWYGTAPDSSNSIDGATLYETSGEAPHLIVVAGGTVYRSVNDGATWSTCTGATLTSGEKCWFVQDHTYLYITNGTDNITRYDGSTTLVTYTALSTPGTPTATKTGLSGSNYSHYYKVSAVNAVGFTAASAASTVVTSGLDRDSWDSSTNYVTLSVSSVSGANRYDWFYSNDGVDYYYLASTSGTSYQDIGSGGAIVNTNIIAPTDNTTQGPKVTRLEQIGTRLWGVQDADNPYRVWFSGAGPYSGYYSSAYDGGYIDLMKGSQYRPVRVVDYRDGKGTPYATVWCSSPDGQGCIWQITLDTLTIGDISITQPSAFRLPGSRGTDAPGSIINVLNDYHFFNSQAFYNLGSRAQFLNLLSTDEISANIRPSVKRITPTAASGIASLYFEAKVYHSVPLDGSTSNNYTVIYDTERKAWIPEAFTIGFERFVPYVDTDGNKRLLAWKNGDTKLTEISENYTGDYGEAFNTSLVTGLYPISKDRFDFMFVETGEVEFSQPLDNIYIELIGIQRNGGYGTLNSETLTVSNSYTNVGWSNNYWSTTLWSSTDNVPKLYSESSIKRYFRVQKELNAYQWRISTTSRESNYLLRTLQISGTLTQGGRPRTWRLT